jgi:hypothetical protein
LIIIAAFEAPGVVTGLDDGVIWALHKSDLDEMDRIEDPKAYRRVKKIVVNENGETAQCNVYVAFPQGDIAADQPYLVLIIAAAKSAGLP